jgi:rhodanese-related sulfurtransferase
MEPGAWLHKERLDMMPAPGRQDEVDFIDSAGLYRRLAAGEALQIVDVREPWEHAHGVVDGAVLLPLGELLSRWQELDATRTTYLICHLGARSAYAAAFLARQGLRAVNVEDGMDGWERQGYPTVC